jgi:capping protein beta
VNQPHCVIYVSRNEIYEIYFGKTRDIVNGLRSVNPLSDGKQQEELRKDLMSALARKNAAKE